MKLKEIAQSIASSQGHRWSKRTIAATVVGLALIVALWPTSLGGWTGFVTVQGTSMQPLLHTGDLAFVHKSDNYHVGDLVAFRLNGGEVIHRLYAGDAKSGFQTKGDNRTTKDPWTISSKQIVGREWFAIPKIGRYYTDLHKPMVLFVLLFTLIMMEAGAAAGKGRRRPRHGRRRVNRSAWALLR